MPDKVRVIETYIEPVQVTRHGSNDGPIEAEEVLGLVR
jgi:hypothetical protein